MDRASRHIAIAREVEKNKNWLHWQRTFAFAAALFAASGAWAQNVVESVTSSIQGGTEVVRIDFAQPLTAVPAGFAIQSPARVALDIPNVTNGMPRSTVEINQ